MVASPTARSLEYARKQGWIAGKCESWIYRPVACTSASAQRKKHWEPLIKRDLFGADLVVYDETGAIWVQATTGANAAARLKKWEGDPQVQTILARGDRWEVWAWRKNAKNRWVLTRRPARRLGEQPGTTPPERSATSEPGPEPT